MAMALPSRPLPVFAAPAVKCKEQHVGIPDHRKVCQPGEEEPALESLELSNRRRLGTHCPGEQRDFVGLRDVAPRGVYHGHFVTSGPKCSDDLNG
jgi:hypothetical protein